MGLFSVNELKRRADQIQGIMKTKQLDCILLSSTANAYYASGVPLIRWTGGRPTFVIVALDKESALITPWTEKYNAEENSWIQDIRPYNDEVKVISSILAEVKNVLAERGLTNAKIGIEKSSLNISDYSCLQQSLPTASFLDVSEDFETLRIVKSPEEIMILRVAAQASMVGAKKFMESIQEGVSELEISAKAAFSMEDWLSLNHPECWSSSFAYCQSGLRTLNPHACSTGKKIQRGELIGLNVFPVVWGYVGELERTIVLGRPNEKQLRAFEAMLEAYRQGIGALRPGVRCSEIDQLTRTSIEKSGYGLFVTHGTGHSFGVESTGGGREERAELRIYNDTALAPGMVISVEPGIYVPSLGGFRHSDMILITSDGYEMLTPFEDGVLIA